MGKRTALIAALSISAFGQSFIAPPTDPWPTQVDQSPTPYLRYSFASQGTQGLKEGAGGLPHGFQVVHVTVVNRSGVPVEVSGAAVYQAAIFAGFIPLGPATAAAVLEGPSKRGKWAVFGHLIDGMLLPGTAVGLAAARVDPRIQIVNGIVQLSIAYLRSGIEARKVDPRAAISRIIPELDSGGHPFAFVVTPASGWGGDIGALYKDRHVAVLIDQRADGSFSLMGTLESGR